MDIAELLSYTKPEGECLIYTRSLNPDGYGRVGNSKAHREMFKLVYGYYPKEVMHSCDVPACINPWHLAGGTHADNMHDGALKGRINRGEKHPKAVLTGEQVAYIRSFFVGGKAPYGTMTRLADELDVSYSTINFVRRGLSWKYSAS